MFEIVERQAARLAYGLVAYTDFSTQIGENVAKVGSILAASSKSFLFLRVLCLPEERLKEWGYYHSHGCFGRELPRIYNRRTSESTPPMSFGK